ncbi:hypothetical protein DL96DRAFT_1721730 [Flagelloscypha sp. PMI_526]|nr:hypothetical protein DL96DRAFT_1721730 [Flagelloscypha sp. PMI_526]
MGFPDVASNEFLMPLAFQIIREHAGLTKEDLESSFRSPAPSTKFSKQQLEAMDSIHDSIQELPQKIAHYLSAAWGQSESTILGKINPALHMIPQRHNSFNDYKTIHSLKNDVQEKGADYTKHLSKLYQKALKEAPDEKEFKADLRSKVKELESDADAQDYHQECITTMQKIVNGMTTPRNIFVALCIPVDQPTVANDVVLLRFATDHRRFGIPETLKVLRTEFDFGGSSRKPPELVKQSKGRTATSSSGTSKASDERYGSLTALPRKNWCVLFSLYDSNDEKLTLGTDNACRKLKWKKLETFTWESLLVRLVMTGVVLTGWPTGTPIPINPNSSTNATNPFFKEGPYSQWVVNFIELTNPKTLVGRSYTRDEQHRIAAAGENALNVPIIEYADGQPALQIMHLSRARRLYSEDLVVLIMGSTLRLTERNAV